MVAVGILVVFVGAHMIHRVLSVLGFFVRCVFLGAVLALRLVHLGGVHAVFVLLFHGFTPFTVDSMEHFDCFYP